MLDSILLFLNALYDLTNVMAFYIIFGLIFAGILHEIVPNNFVNKHLGDDNILSVIKSTIFGIPLPVCSCGVIPLATSLKKDGASNGATLSFLISTPITGVDSLMATYGIFGWIFMLYRMITSLIIAIIAGILTNIFVKKEVKKSNLFTTVKPVKEKTVDKTSCCSRSSSNTAQKKFSIKNAWKYGFVTLLGDIAKPLFWGLPIGALITVSIPDNLSTFIGDNIWLSYVIVMPMYVCATSSLPIVAGLIISGVSIGAGFVFLTAGSATNTVTIGVVKKMLGKKSLFIYLGTIIVGSITFGIALDVLFETINIDVKSLVNMENNSGILEIISSAILWSAILYFLIYPFLTKKSYWY